MAASWLIGNRDNSASTAAFACRRPASAAAFRVFKACSARPVARNLRSKRPRLIGACRGSGVRVGAILVTDRLGRRFGTIFDPTRPHPRRRRLLLSASEPSRREAGDYSRIDGAHLDRLDLSSGAPEPDVNPTFMTMPAQWRRLLTSMQRS